MFIIKFLSISSQQMAVPNELIGLIIGKGGVNVKRIQAETGAKLDVQKGEPNGKTIIEGSVEQVRKNQGDARGDASEWGRVAKTICKIFLILSQ